MSGSTDASPGPATRDFARTADRGGRADSPVGAPVLSLPKAGGAIRGIGEKFTANPVTGTGSMSVPLPVSDGRSGFDPELTLRYDSGRGNGPFGFGWSLSLPAVTRRTDRGLPSYDDIAESDVYLLSDAEDLVPVRTATTRAPVGYRVDRYRPRIEGLYARIERWTRLDDGDIHWRSTTRDGLTTVYGKDSASRIVDPHDPRRVFSWLICESHDATGNAAIYTYRPENADGVAVQVGHERNRDPLARTVNRYLKSVRYGNRVSRLSRPDLADADWMFEVVFDYGEHHAEAPRPGDPGSWSTRRDAFSSCRAGFEVRAYRLCRRVLMFHHFPGAAGVGSDCLVRSLDLGYREEPIGSFLVSFTTAGYRRVGPGYRRRALPPVELTYSEPVLHTEVAELDATSAANLPAGLTSGYQWTDLDGDGLPGVLTEQAGTWFYKPNLGDGRLGAAKAVARPSTASLIGGRQQLLDLAGDGHLDLVDFAGPLPGFAERTDDGWTALTPFTSLPAIDWTEDDLRFVDLDGDGRADVLITDAETLRWYPSLGEDGFGPAREVSLPTDDERGPRLVFADGTRSVYLADLSGDGLTDLVRIRNGSVSYWPNLGHGRFGARVDMANAPWFDRDESFDQRRVRLSDVDGTGPTDLIYLGADGIRLYANECGNSWAEPVVLGGLPSVDGVAAVSTVDLFGAGTTCLVWSSPLAGETVRYVDLMGGGKPHLLVESRNNAGARTTVDYVSSTRFQLADRAAGRPWLTRLPFPVQVVERVTTHDDVSGNTLVTSYAYHHGYFDGVEREFRGFGMVEQTDAEHIGAVGDVPPVLTRTWFHPGHLDRDVSSRFADEYFRDPAADDTDPAAALLPDTILPDGVRGDELREACRALKGAVLRQEVYALDGGAAQARPYLVTERNYTVQCLQRRGANRYAVFATHPRETLTHSYERTTDPRTSHQLTLAVDDVGNVLRSASVAYPRRVPGTVDPLLPTDARLEIARAQSTMSISLTENTYTNAVDDRTGYRTPLIAESRDYEVLGITPAAARFDLAELADALHGLVDGRSDLPAERFDEHDGTPARRLVDHTRTYYRGDDLGGRLPLGVLESMALPSRTDRLALTSGLVSHLYGDRVDAGMLAEAGYLGADGGWWVPSGQRFYSPDPTVSELAHARAHFFLPHRFRDPYGNETVVGYDRDDLLVRHTRDAVGHEVDAEYDYRVLRPVLLTDANRNRGSVAYDTLGRPAGTAVMGKDGEPVGDTLDGFESDVDDVTLAGFIADPAAAAPALLAGATTRVIYDEYAFERSGLPTVAASIARVTHVTDLEPGESSELQLAFRYSDGLGREIQTKVQAEPEPSGAPRWVGSGWVVFNNKAKPVRRYEPFFSAGHGFEFARAVGVSAVLHYDPRERVVATVLPHGGYEKVVVDAWRQTTWDANDTVLLDPRTDPDVAGFAGAALAGRPDWRTWLERHRGEPVADKAAAHAGTPTVVHTDPLGRAVAVVAHDGSTPLATRSRLDIEGNLRAVVDAAGRIAARYGYDLLGNRVSIAGIDAGERSTLLDVTGNPCYAWDARGFRTYTEYDALRRPVATRLTGPGLPGEVFDTRVVYGDDAAANLRTRVFRRFDSAGITTNAAYDFKGNLLDSRRQLVAGFAATVDHATPVMLSPETFVSTTSYDAMNRPVETTAPDGSITGFTYNDANLLERLEVRLPNATASTAFVTAVEYNARGQRLGIDHGNGTRTSYDYDQETFQLTALRTAGLQDIAYTYDPVGNMAARRDTAQQTVFFANRVVEPSADYTYDALYRLVEATGREHIGDRQPPSTSDEPRVGVRHPGDGTALGRYRQRYRYDQTGNLVEVTHRGTDPAHPGWRRRYHYAEPSWLDPAATGNRLSAVDAGDGTPSQPIDYDEHGNTVAMPGIESLTWDPRDRLRASVRQAVTAGTTPETGYYDYDADGNRIRKVTLRATGSRRTERIYLGSFERYREYAGDGVTVVLERTTLHVVDGQRRVALVETRTVGTDPGAARLTRYQLADHQGSSCVEVDDAGKVISHEEYHPYGSTAYQAARAATPTPKRYRYTGKERDAETGLYHHGSRYYAPWLGRWTSLDPAGMVDGPNGYVYVRDNPVRYTDPTGSEAEIEPAWRSVIAIRDYVVGAYERVRGHHILQSSAYTASRGAPDPHHAGALSISQSDGNLTRPQHAQATKTQGAANRALHSATTGRDVTATAGSGANKVTVRSFSPRVDLRVPGGGTLLSQPAGRLAPTATPWFEEVKGFFALRAADVPQREALALVQAAAADRELVGSAPQRVPNAPRAKLPVVGLAVNAVSSLVQVHDLKYQNRYKYPEGSPRDQADARAASVAQFYPEVAGVIGGYNSDPFGLLVELVTHRNPSKAARDRFIDGFLSGQPRPGPDETPRISADTSPRPDRVQPAPTAAPERRWQGFKF